MPPICALVSCCLIVLRMCDCEDRGCVIVRD
uniref:Uncharacterized protein n=1 Tax=Arundo donax TaxID=35708 RepID=A0A0A9BSV0_ARUDO